MDHRITKHPLGFWEIADKPSISELEKYYAEKYYQEGKGSYELQYSDDELRYFNAKLEQRWSVLQKTIQTTGSGLRFLDVGCGEGFALSFFRSKGWTVKGIDFSSAGVKSKNPDCLDSLETGDVFELLKKAIDSREQYDVVWLQNVLEHVLDPLELLVTLRSLVKADGMLVLTVPNDCSMTQLAALDRNHIDHAFWIAPPDHLTYFDHVSLVNAANETGWHCAEMLADFPVDWFLFNPASNYVRDKSVGKSAHYARVQIENAIHQQPMEDVIRFWSAAAQLGVGRDITVFLQPTERQ